MFSGEYSAFSAASGNADLLQEKPRNRLRKAATMARSAGKWLWSGYCKSASATFIYDENGVAHSIKFWY
ncbi:MAG TPA: hypothetical protein VH186_38225 [Chloroflexia bacterium]|nr:hypothetical protein [Chloroflexia bacterium]